MSLAPIQFPTREREPNFDEKAIRKIISDLLVLTPDEVESEQIEIKGWCNTEKELAEKVSEACSCLANTSGGFVVVGVSEEKGSRSKFSRCPHACVTKNWLITNAHNLTKPPVECSPHDVSDILAEILGVAGNNLFVLRVPRTRYISGHVTNKGISKVRVGKECHPHYIAEDDRTRAAVPDLTLDDLLAESLEWGMIHHRKHFKNSTQWTDRAEFLAQAGLVDAFLPDEEYVPRYRISLAGLLLFGKAAAIARHCSFFETIFLTSGSPFQLRKNIIESVRELTGGQVSLLGCLLPQVPADAIRELLVNSYIHRCYRTPSPVVIRASETGIEIQNPGELLTGLTVSNLINGIPAYRNLLLADAARFVGLCDKVGQGIDVVYRGVLSGGLGFPEFESGNNFFTARVSLDRNEKFQEFMRQRAHALNQLDEIIVLRVLWSKESATLDELCSRMQRKEEYGTRVLVEMTRKQMIRPTQNSSHLYELLPIVRRDIETISRFNQLPLGLNMWGDS